MRGLIKPVVLIAVLVASAVLALKFDINAEAKKRLPSPEIFAEIDWYSFEKVNHGRVINQGQRVLVPFTFTKPEDLEVLKNTRVGFGRSPVLHNRKSMSEYTWSDANIKQIDAVPFTVWLAMTIGQDGKWSFQPVVYKNCIHIPFNASISVVSFGGKVAFASDNSSAEKMMVREIFKGQILSDEMLEEGVKKLQQRLSERHYN